MQCAIQIPLSQQLTEKSFLSFAFRILHKLKLWIWRQDETL